MTADGLRKNDTDEFAKRLDFKRIIEGWVERSETRHAHHIV